MAKVAKILPDLTQTVVPESPAVESPTVTTLADILVHWGDNEYRLGDLPIPAAVYFIRQGFKPAWDDVAANKKAISETPVEFDVDGQKVKRLPTESEVADQIAAMRAAKWDKILKGEMTSRGGGARLTEFERILRTCAEEYVRRIEARKRAKGESVKTATGKDLAALVAKASAFESVINEANERLARLKDIEVEGEDLF